MRPRQTVVWHQRLAWCAPLPPRGGIFFSYRRGQEMMTYQNYLLLVDTLKIGRKGTSAYIFFEGILGQDFYQYCINASHYTPKTLQDRNREVHILRDKLLHGKVDLNNFASNIIKKIFIIILKDAKFYTLTDAEKEIDKLLDGTEFVRK